MLSMITAGNGFAIYGHPQLPGVEWRLCRDNKDWVAWRCRGNDDVTVLGAGDYEAATALSSRDAQMQIWTAQQVSCSS